MCAQFKSSLTKIVALHINLRIYYSEGSSHKFEQVAGLSDRLCAQIGERKEYSSPGGCRHGKIYLYDIKCLGQHMMEYPVLVHLPRGHSVCRLLFQNVIENAHLYRPIGQTSLGLVSAWAC